LLWNNKAGLILRSTKRVAARCGANDISRRVVETAVDQGAIDVALDDVAAVVEYFEDAA